MPDTTQTKTETTSADGQGETPKPLTAADVEALFEAKLSGYTSKINGEIASLRKAVKGETPKPAEPAAPKPVTHDDLTAVRELGRLEARMGDEMMNYLGGNEVYAKMGPTEQALVLSLIANAPKPKTETVDADATSRGETPAKNTKNPRGEAPRPRDGVPRPATRREYIAMKKEHRDALKSDSTFDPTVLPY